VRPGLLYAGTEFGVYVSTDDGAHWTRLQRNLPAVPVTDLEVRRDGDLVISTQGRAFWILDDVGALREAAQDGQWSAIAGAPSHLFTPRPAMRLRYRARFGGEESSRGAAVDPEYPPPGASLDYWVGTAPRGAVLALDVRDAQGTLVRSFTSAGAGERTQPVADNMRRPDVETLGTPRLDATPGMHRFTWDMAHPGPIDAGSPRSGRNGPLAAPGRYTVRLAWLDASGKPAWQMERPLELRPDPRVVQDGMTPALFAAQLAHERSARDLVTTTNALVARVRSARARLAADSAAGRAADARTLAGVRALEAALVAEAVRYGRPGLQTQVQYLYGMTLGADQPVGRDARERLAELRRMVDARRREADALLGAASEVADAAR
jgi:hypothetical protein